jgi:hypothetical protein
MNFKRALIGVQWLMMTVGLFTDNAPLLVYSGIILIALVVIYQNEKGGGHA